MWDELPPILGTTLLTYKLKHHRNFSEELRKARQIAEFAPKTISNTSKDVRQFGLKSVIANQILRKYCSNKKAKKGIQFEKLTKIRQRAKIASHSASP